jgi:hypothetical protein
VILLAGWYGRLGNRLRTFAHVIAAAIDVDCRVLNPCLDATDAMMFEHLASDPLCRFPAKRTKLPGTPTTRRVAGHLAGRLAGYLRSGRTLPGVSLIDLGWRKTLDVSSPAFQNQLRHKRIMVLSGFRFYHPDLWSYREPIRAFFEPATKHRNSASSLLLQARKDCDVLVGVHVRRDVTYQWWRQGTYYYDQTTYIDLIERVSRLFSTERVGFLVCGNERLDLESTTERPLTHGTGVRVEDLCALAKCDYLLGPPSTFSSWASFYGDVPRYVVMDPRQPLTLEAFLVDHTLDFSDQGLAPRSEKRM